jgi:predicted aconitase with swiveling domain
MRENCDGGVKMELKGRKICRGKVEGEILKSNEPMSFYGGVDPETGVVQEKGHPLEGKSIKEKILVFPSGKGSTVGSYTMYWLKKSGAAPKAIINKECETIVAVGAIISEIPCVDKIDIDQLNDGDTVEVDADNGVVRKK